MKSIHQSPFCKAIDAVFIFFFIAIAFFPFSLYSQDKNALPARERAAEANGFKIYDYAEGKSPGHKHTWRREPGKRHSQNGIDSCVVTIQQNPTEGFGIPTLQMEGVFNWWMRYMYNARLQ